MKAATHDAQALNLKYQPLSREVEQRLLRQAKGRNKKRAAAARLKLFESLLPWALSCSNRWAKTLTVDERASAAAVVIGQAIEKYDPSYGTRLSTIIPKPMRWILLRQQELQQRMTTGAGTLKEAGAKMGITRERVRQIQKRAVERMREVGVNGNGHS